MYPTINIEKVDKNIKIRRAIWNVACALLFRPFPTLVFWPWRRFVLGSFGAKIHPKAHVYSSVKIWAPWNLHMEEGACLGPHVICYNQAMVKIEENAVISQYSYLCTAGHDTTIPNNSERGLVVAAISIGKNAWIGTRAFIGMGVEVGEDAVVGATASVYKDVEPHTIVGGNPAKVIKEKV